MWCVAAGVVLLYALFLFLQSDFVREYLRGRLVVALEGILDREVEIDSLDFQLLPLWAELRGVEIGGPTPDDPPIAELGRLFVEAEILGWRQPVISLRQVRIEEPYIRLEFFEEGGRNWPSFRRGDDESKARSATRRMPPVRIGVDYLSLERGTLELDHMRMPLELSARTVQGFMSGSPETQLHGRIAAQQVSVKLPRARPFLGAVGLKVAVSPDGVELAGGRVSGPHLNAYIQGHAGWDEDREITVHVQASGSSDFFRQVGYLEDQILGPFTFQGGVVWRPRNWDFEGDVTSPSLVIYNRQVDDIAVIARGSNEGIRIEVQSAHYGDGTLTGTVTYDHQAEGRPFEVDLALAGVDLQQIVDDQELPVRGLAGRVDGVFDYRFPVGDARNGEGWADLKFTPRQDVPDGFPVSGSVPLTIEGGVIRTAAGRIISGAHRIGAEGFYDLETRAGRFEYEIATDDLEKILELMPILEEGEPLPLWYPTEGTGEVIGTLVLEPGEPRTDLQLSLDYAVARGVRAQQVRASMAIGGDGLERLRVELTQPDAGVLVTGSIPFGADEESAEPPVPFEIAVDAARWPVDQALSWLPFELPLDGRVSGSLVLSGQLEALVGELRARLEPAVVAGIECTVLRLDLDFDPERLVVQSGVLESGAGDVVLRGEIDQITEALNLVVEASALDLSQPPFSSLVTEPLIGQLAARAVIQGT